MTKEFKVTVRNIPDTEIHDYIVVRVGNREFEYYGSYETPEKAEFVSRLMENTFVVWRGAML